MADASRAAPTVARRDTDAPACRRPVGLSTPLRALFAAALALGFLVRAVPAIGADFPLGDGGLFVAMAERIRSDGPLPLTVDYNGRSLPFTYPPLGLYLVALSPLPILDTMIVLPVLFSFLAVIAVAALARTLLRDQREALVAVFAFAVLPLAFRYFILAAGVTRALGLLFAVLTLLFLYQALRDRRPRDVVLAGACLAGTVLSHPNAAWFAAVSAIAFVGVLARDRRAVLRAAEVAAVGLALSLPWWLPTIARHGVVPFLFAAQSGNPQSPGWQTLMALRFTGEVPPPILALGAVLGVALSIWHGALLVPAWLVASCATDIRYDCTFASVPVALLVAVAAGPFLRRATEDLHVLVHGGSVHARRALPTLLLAAATAYAVGSAFLIRDPAIAPLSPAQRAALTWVADHLPAGSRSVVLEPGGVGAGSASEWFPVLTGRISVGTYQGTEWLGRLHPSGWELYEQLQRCAFGDDVGCLDRWSAIAGEPFTHVFLRTDRSPPLAGALRRSPAYRVAYENDGVVIFERVSGGATRDESHSAMSATWRSTMPTASAPNRSVGARSFGAQGTSVSG
jgi:hypothetical protein